MKSGLNQRNRRLRPFFTLFSSFYTSRGGGSEAPTRQLARLGSPVKTSPNLLAEKNQPLILVPVLRLLLRELYGPTHILTIFRNGAERLNNLNEEKYDDSNLLALPLGYLNGLCENGLKLCGRMMLRQKLAYDCLRFYVRRTALVAHLCRANRWFFITDF